MRDGNLRLMRLTSRFTIDREREQGDFVKVPGDEFFHHRQTCNGPSRCSARSKALRVKQIFSTCSLDQPMKPPHPVMINMAISSQANIRSLLNNRVRNL